MTKITLTLAAALLASTTLSGAAIAGGIRVGFGFPLGSFVAHEHQNYSSAPSYSANKHCDKPVRAARHEVREEAAVRKVSHRAPKVEVANDEPAPRKIKRAPKVEVAEEEAPAPRVIKAKPAEIQAPVQVANLDDKAVTSDAAPSIYVPESPVTEFKGTQSTPAAITTASVTSAVVKDVAKVEQPKIEKVVTIEQDEPKAKAKTETGTASTAKRLCRRFSAAIAGLIDVPCE